MGQVRSRLQLIDAMSAPLKKIEARIHAVNNAFSDTSLASKVTQQVQRDIDRQANAARGAANANNQNKNSLDNYNNSGKKAVTITDQLTTKLRRLANTYLGVMGAAAMIQTSDALTRAQNQLGTIYSQTIPQEYQSERGLEISQTESLDKVFAAAQRARTGFTDMATNVSKSMVLAGDAFANNIDNAIRFQEIMGKAYAVGGASAAEQASSMYQMVQALGSGVLQGDELRSVREGAAMAYKAIEEYAQGVYNSTESLKDMASEGMITSDLVVAAILNAGDQMDEMFENTTMTFGQMWTMFKNDATQAFRPALKALNELANSDAARTFYEHFRDAMYMAGQIATNILGGIQTILNFLANHFWLVELAAVAAASVIGGLFLNSVVNAFNAIRNLNVALATTQGRLILVVGVIALVGYALYHIWETTHSLVNVLFVLATTFVVVGIAAAAAGMTTFGWIMLIASAVIALVALILAYLPIILQQVFKVAARIWNTIATLQNFIFGVVNSLNAAWIWLTNSWGAKWRSMWNSVKADAYDAVVYILELINGALESISGLLSAIGIDVDLTNTIARYRGKASTARGVAASEQALSDSTFATSFAGTVADAWHEGFNTNELLDVDAFGEKGFAYGTLWQQQIEHKFDKFMNNFAGVSDINDGISDLLTNIDPNAYTPKGAGGGGSGGSGGAGDKLDDIADDTSKISDTLELSEQDLAYIRDVAEMEWKKEFTTASVVINMENNNVINNESDLDGLVQKIADVMETELSIVADGVYT